MRLHCIRVDVVSLYLHFQAFLVPVEAFGEFYTAITGMHTKGGGGGRYPGIYPPEQVSPKVKPQYSFAANNNETIRKEVECSQLFIAIFVCTCIKCIK